MRNVHIKRTVSLRLTANDWELYGGDEHRDREDIAAKINDVLEHLINNHQDKEPDTVYYTGCKVLNKFAKAGAADTEGRYTWAKVCEQVWPEHRFW